MNAIDNLSFFNEIIALKILDRLEVFLFFVWILETVFPLIPMFSEGPSFFVSFVCNDGALNLRLRKLALPASVTMSWPAEST